MPSIRGLTSAGCLVALFGLSGVAAAQPAAPGSELGIGIRLGIGFGVSLVVYLVLGGLLVGLGPTYATHRVAEIHEDVGAAFVWGLLVGIGVPIALVILAITIIGLIVTIPGLFVLLAVSLVGTAVSVVWIGDLLVGDDGGRVGGREVAVGALALAIPAAIPVIGNLLVQLVGLFGMGVVGRGLYESWAS